MPRTIWKYPLAVTEKQAVPMPDGATLRAVATQHETPVLYAEVDPNRPDNAREIYTFGTGHPIPETPALRYVGTYLLEGGRLVFHVYERA